MTQQNEPSAPQRVALYGGAFDPVHLAHLQVARSAVETARLDQVVFIPAAHSPLKLEGPRASDADRLLMLELAIEKEKTRFSIDQCELERGGVSYSFETVELYRRKLPEAELFWILGADQFTQLADWRAADLLAGMVTFLVLARPGYSMKVPKIEGIRYEMIPAPLMESSSSEIRARLKQGEPLNDWLSPAVEAFIYEKGLYV
ncbi:MAG: nicotinate-nucleotide adenylyltransferase [Verrucomicrobiota bacterium]